MTDGAVGPALTAEDWQSLRFAPSEWMYTCLCVPAMGDAEVPDVAQVAHQWVFRNADLLTDSR